LHLERRFASIQRHHPCISALEGIQMSKCGLSSSERDDSGEEDMAALGGDLSSAKSLG